MAENYELMDVILVGPHVPIWKVKEGKITKLVTWIQSEYDEDDHKNIEKKLQGKENA